MIEPSTSPNPQHPTNLGGSDNSPRQHEPAIPPVVLRVWRDEPEPPSASGGTDGRDDDLQRRSSGRQQAASGQEPASEPLDESEDIEVYMQQWLRRVRGEAATGGTPPDEEPGQRTDQLPTTTPAAAPRRTGNPPGGTPPSSPGTKAGGGGSLTDPLPQPGLVDGNRSHAACDHPLELRALREVANQSSQAAINHSLRRQFRRELLSKGAVALVALAVSAVLLLLSPAPFSLLTLGASVCGLVAGIWSLRIVADWRTYRARRARRTASS
ncbi:MAG: hypothetical protein J5I93_18055 [Pirellulaceae bacterium]|nr:hypothetical protein [Pirellulaceae bacterium]